MFRSVGRRTLSSLIHIEKPEGRSNFFYPKRKVKNAMERTTNQCKRAWKILCEILRVEEENNERKKCMNCYEIGFC